MRIQQAIATFSVLTASAVGWAHGPHVEVQASGMVESLLHLLAHAWPVAPIALIAVLMYRRYIRD